MSSHYSDSRRSIWRRAFFNYVCIGSVQRDGKTYRKYKIVPRFQLVNKLLLVILFYLVLGASILLFLDAANREMHTAGKHPERVRGAGAGHYPDMPKE